MYNKITTQYILLPVTDSLFPNLSSYDVFLSTLKQRVRTAQMRAALAVNQELVLLYWQIGKEILQRQHSEGWGTKAGQTHLIFITFTGHSFRRLFSFVAKI